MAHVVLDFIESIIVFLGRRKSNTLSLSNAIIRGCSALGNWNLEIRGWVKRPVPPPRSLGRKENSRIVLGVRGDAPSRGSAAALPRHVLDALKTFTLLGISTAVN